MGYKLGMGISVLILLIVGLVIWLMLRPKTIGSPTAATTTQGALNRITVKDLKKSIATLLPPRHGSGAGKVYVALYRLVHRHRHLQVLLGNVRGNDYPERRAKWQAWLKKMEAAAALRMKRTALRFHNRPDRPSYNVPRDLSPRILEAVAAQTGASYTAEHHFHRARAAFNAMLAFGYRLWKRGVYVRNKGLGLSTMDSAATGLATIYGDKPLANLRLQNAAARLERRLAAAGNRWLAMQKIVHVMSPVPGDLANIVMHGGNRCWRLEALEYLGVSQWRVHSKGRHKAIRKFLHSYAHASDHFIAGAALDALHTSRLALRSF